MHLRPDKTKLKKYQEECVPKPSISIPAPSSHLLHSTPAPSFHLLPLFCSPLIAHANTRKTPTYPPPPVGFFYFIRVTANSLEVHNKREPAQLRRAKEKHLLASLQTFLFADRDKAPTASEVTYNYVLECAVSELRNRDRTRQGLSPVAAADEADTTEAAEGVGGDASGCAAALGGKADTEKHKIKEQQRRAKKRQLLTVLQGLVLGDGAAPKAASVTGNFILELVVEQLQRERDQKVQVET